MVEQIKQKHAPKRFIAGAVCPKCGEMDKIVVYSNNEGSFRECVVCDFHEKQRFDTQHAELQTRVNQAEEKVQSETQVLTLDPKNPL